jgi:hypothetical protein
MMSSCLPDSEEHNPIFRQVYRHYDDDTISIRMFASIDVKVVMGCPAIQSR